MKDHGEHSVQSAPLSAEAGVPAAGSGTAPSGHGGHRQPEHLEKLWASHRVWHLFFKLTIYYALITTVVYTALTRYPQLHTYLPIGGALARIGDVTKDPFTVIEMNATQITSLAGSVLWLFIAICGAFLTILPVSWTYMAIRKRSDYDQSLVETILLLPIAVACLVILVHDSITMAFSLAGIVAVVRFRNTLKSTGDALYVMVAIGIGLSAGLGAIEVGIVLSLAFNFCNLILWITDYGSHHGTRRYMRRARRVLGERDDEAGAEDPD